MPPDLSEKNSEATIEQALTQTLPAPGPATAKQEKGPVPGGRFTGVTVSCYPCCRSNGVSAERIVLCRYH
jgi:hypothetical protein